MNPGLFLAKIIPKAGCMGPLPGWGALSSIAVLVFGGYPPRF